MPGRSHVDLLGNGTPRPALRTPDTIAGCRVSTPRATALSCRTFSPRSADSRRTSCPFDEVRSRLKLARGVDRGLEDVPLERGSAARWTDLRVHDAFLPRRESLRERWEDVATLAEGHRGFPPVQLYRVGDVYFVVDGHHRVSVARSLGAESIEARITRVRDPGAASPGRASLEDVVLREGLAGFLEATGPSAGAPGRVAGRRARRLRRLDHIAEIRYFLGLDRQRDVSWEEAVASFRDTVYRPMVERIRTSAVLDDFPAGPRPTSTSSSRTTSGTCASGSATAPCRRSARWSTSRCGGRRSTARRRFRCSASGEAGTPEAK